MLCDALRSVFAALIFTGLVPRHKAFVSTQYDRDMRAFYVDRSYWVRSKHMMMTRGCACRERRIFTAITRCSATMGSTRERHTGVLLKCRVSR